MDKNELDTKAESVERRRATGVGAVKLYSKKGNLKKTVHVHFDLASIGDIEASFMRFSGKFYSARQLVDMTDDNEPSALLMPLFLCHGASHNNVKKKNDLRNGMSFMDSQMLLRAYPQSTQEAWVELRRAMNSALDAWSVVVDEAADDEEDEEGNDDADE